MESKYFYRLIFQAYEANPKQDRLEMEALLDMVQPGWRDVIVKQRLLPNMVVYNSLVTAAE
jgi:hypothetical protein